MHITGRSFVLSTCFALLLFAACSSEEASDVPEQPPEGFEGSCAEQLHTWDAIRDDPEIVKDFLCIDAPEAGATVERGATLDLWASYEYTPEITIDLQVTDSSGRTAMQSYPRSYDDPGTNEAFWMIGVQGAQIPIPAESPPGDEVNVLVTIVSAESGENLVSSEVTVRLAQ